MDREFTDKEQERIDYIQGLAHDFIANLIPDEKRRQEMLDSCNYDFDLIDRLIRTVWEGVKDKAGCTEREFYPYRDEDDIFGDDDPSVDCSDFYWADLDLAEDHPKCCEMCGNFDEKKGKCSLA